MSAPETPPLPTDGPAATVAKANQLQTWLVDNTADSNDGASVMTLVLARIIAEQRPNLIEGALQDHTRALRVLVHKLLDEKRRRIVV